ncbi:MAG: hypothetical protein M3209_06475 [Acidobacteriota bacterium]|nr:hypothetical protein [Acidobacteriota bacterium]
MRKLLIEDKDGVRFEVLVGAEIYERAQIGRQIKSSKSGVEIFPDETNPLNLNH